jgi:hypothetical protein
VSRVRAQVRLAEEIPVFEMEELWYDLSRWPAFIDGFASVAKVDAGWPREGALVWQSHPAGRGRVVERVTRFEARIGQDVEVEDPKITGVQRVRFAPGGMSLELEYRLKDRNPLLDLLFVRRAQRDALQRTLNRFAIELRTDREIRAGRLA